MPVDVEPAGEAAGAAPCQHVEPEAIGGAADAHVVRHDVEDQAEAVRAEGGRHGAEVGLAAELGVEAGRVGDVVAVGAAGARREDRRGVDVADAEVGEVGRERGRVGEAEGRGELQPVGGAEAHGWQRDADARPAAGVGFGAVGGVEEAASAAAAAPRGRRRGWRGAGAGAGEPPVDGDERRRRRRGRCRQWRPAAARCGTIIVSRRIASSRRVTKASQARPAGVSRAAQSRRRGREGGGIVGVGDAGAARRGRRRRRSGGTRGGGLRGPRRRARPSKSVKKAKGRVSPHSSPMNISGTCGERSRIAVSARTIGSGASASSRSPKARLPTWSWFCRKSTKAVGGRWPLGTPRGVAGKGDGSPW